MPPRNAVLRQARSNLAPDALLVVPARIRYGELVKRLEHGVDSVQFGATGGAFGNVDGNSLLVLGVSLAVADQFFFGEMLHRSVPKALACEWASRNGSRARRNF